MREDAAYSFGFRDVSATEKTALVGQVFSSVADRYDLMNDLMSGGLHRLWKDHMVRAMRVRAHDIQLDVAGGTGDIAFRCYRSSGGKAQITVVDLNKKMLEVGRRRALDRGILPAQTGIQWVQADAEDLPFASRSVTLYSSAFGLRNVTRLDRALDEAFRVLRPGGRFFCLEFSPSVLPALRSAYGFYLKTALPLLGAVVTKDAGSYDYLAESIQRFAAPAQLSKSMEAAGFSSVKFTRLSGGIAYLHRGIKL